MRVTFSFSAGCKPVHRVLGLCFLLLLFACTPDGGQVDYSEHDIDALQALLERGDLSSGGLTQYYLDRIDAIDRNGPH